MRYSLPALALLLMMAMLPSLGNMQLRESLLQAARECGELAEKGEAGKVDLGLEGTRHPRNSHLLRYAQLRPWIMAYGEIRIHTTDLVMKPAPVEWPATEQAQALRKLLADDDPTVLALAIEALAVAHQPEDVPLIARFLDDARPGAWTLERHPYNRMELYGFVQQDPLEEDYQWASRPVGWYAARALKLMTGEEFTAEQFAAWWPGHANWRECLWYWQERIARGLRPITAEVYRLPYSPEGGLTRAEWERWRWQEVPRRKAEFMRGIAGELRDLPPEAETKILLLAEADYSANPFLDGLATPRLERERLFALLDRQNLWPDIDWSERAPYYSRLVSRLLVTEPPLFRPEDVERLRAWQQRRLTRGSAFIIGLSRLLPAGDPANLDDPDTRDGLLRRGIREEKEVFTRGNYAGELIRVAAAPNWPFLKEQFFAEQDGTSYPDLRVSIIDALGAVPLTPEKRAALIDLVLVERFLPLWTRPSLRMGDDAYRRQAALALNNHAGKELITWYEVQQLRDEKDAPAMLAAILKKVRGMKP